MLDTFNVWLATGFGLGLAPVAPGTFGSLIGLPLAWWLLGRPTGQQAAIIALMLVAAVPVCHHRADADGRGAGVSYRGVALRWFGSR